MKLSNKISSIFLILKVATLKKKIPLAVRWDLTYRCPLACAYCSLRSLKMEEVKTDKVLAVLKELARLGTKKISFSGGEPMFRQDMGEIINFCVKNGISAEMNSTGFLIPERRKEIKGLDLLKLSLDGPAEIHDAIRGKKGAYQWAMNAAEAAAREKIPFIFTATLTKHNIDSVEFLINVSKKFKTAVAFQPLKALSRGCSVEQAHSLYPSQESYKKAIDSLIKWKKADKHRLRNSMRGLLHIYNWPYYKRLKCGAGHIFCMILPNADVYPCDRIHYDVELPNCVRLGFKEAFLRLPEVKCSGCGFCGSLELNYLMAFKWDIIGALSKIVR